MIEIINNNIKLREFTPEDKYRLADLANNKKIAINLRDGFPHPYTLKDAENFLNMCSKYDPPQLFAIEYNKLHVGNISLIKGNDVYRKSAEIGYFLGEPYWNKGIMTIAVNLICDYGFQNLDIERIYTGIFDFNPASQRVLEKCGFTKEAVFKKAIYKNGVICDEIRYAKLREEPSI